MTLEVEQTRWNGLYGQDYVFRGYRKLPWSLVIAEGQEPKTPTINVLWHLLI